MQLFPQVAEARSRIAAAASSSSAEKRNKSVLEKLILRCGPDSSVPAVIAFDMCIAGIDTTGNTIAFALGFLSRNQRAQVWASASHKCNIVLSVLYLQANFFSCFLQFNIQRLLGEAPSRGEGAEADGNEHRPDEVPLCVHQGDPPQDSHRRWHCKGNNFNHLL